MTVKITTPSKSLLQGAEYTNSATTDIEQTWRKFGWLPKQEREADLKAQQTVKRLKAKERTDARP